MLLRLIDYLIGRRHRNIVKKNLLIAFPDYDHHQRRRLLREIYRHFAMVFIDNIYMFVKKHPERLMKKVEIRNAEALEQVLARKKGAIVFSAHFGNWELVPYLLSRRLGGPVASIARRMDNPLVEQVIRQFRERMGSIILYKKNSLRGILKHLDENRAVYLLIDQNAIEREAVKVQFFGQEVSAIQSVSQLLVKRDCPVVPLFLHYEEDRVILEFLDEIRRDAVPPRQPGAPAPEKEEIRLITQTLNHIIEDQIRKHPGQWFWFHNRFKNHPVPARSET